MKKSLIEKGILLMIKSNVCSFGDYRLTQSHPTTETCIKEKKNELKFCCKTNDPKSDPNSFLLSTHKPQPPPPFPSHLNNSSSVDDSLFHKTMSAVDFRSCSFIFDQKHIPLLQLPNSFFLDISSNHLKFKLCVILVTVQSTDF